MDPHFYDPRAERAARRSTRRPWRLWVWLIGLLGGVGGTLAAILEESTHGVWLMVVLVGPAIEEICKPIAVVFLIYKRPDWLRSRGEVVAMSLLGAAVFATLENLVYVYVYAPSVGPGFAMFRFTVCTTLHLTATAVFAVGLAKMWRKARERGGGFDIDVCFRYYVAAVVIHAGYNITVTVLNRFGLLRF